LDRASRSQGTITNTKGGWANRRRQDELPCLLVTGAVYGFAIYIINFQIVVPAMFARFVMARAGISIFSDTMFGMRLITTGGEEMMRYPLFSLFLALFFVVPHVALGEERYPTRNITLVVPFPPAGAADLAARPLANELAKIVHQPVVVLNRPGAGGAIGMEQVANAPADGYTLLVTLPSISIIPEAEKVMGRQPPYRLDQFAPVARTTADPLVLIVRDAARWKSIRDLVADAKKKPEKITYGSSGVYGVLHLAFEMFDHAADIRLYHVPYQGAAPAIVAAVAGQIDATGSGPAALLPHITSGKLRPLVVWGVKRSPALPDVPTFREAGFDVDFVFWSGLFAPAGMRSSTMKTLRAAVAKAAQSPELASQMEKMGSSVAYMDAPEFGAFWERDAKRIAEAIGRIGRIEKN